MDVRTNLDETCILKSSNPRETRETLQKPSKEDSVVATYLGSRIGTKRTVLVLIMNRAARQVEKYFRSTLIHQDHEKCRVD